MKTKNLIQIIILIAILLAGLWLLALVIDKFIEPSQTPKEISKPLTPTEKCDSFCAEDSIDNFLINNSDNELEDLCICYYGATIGVNYVNQTKSDEKRMVIG